MHSVLKAVAEPSDTRAAYWRNIVASSVGGMDVHLERNPDEWDQITIGELGALRMIESRSGPGEATRTAKHVRHNDPERYILFVQAQGWALGEQNGRSARFRPGDLGLADLSRPLRCAHNERRAVMISYPKALCPLRERELALLLGARMPGTRGVASMVSSLVRQLPVHLDTSDPAQGTRVGSAVLDLINAMLADVLDREQALTPEARHRVMLLRCRRFIEDNLADPELTPIAVAAAQHVSLRYLYRLFESSGDTVAGLIRRRRLERCRHDLTDPDLAARPASAIGARWGLRDPAHFSRAFRSAYGLPPAAFRAEWCSARRE